MKFRITGTLGVIHRAKQLKIIDKVKPLIDKLMLTDFRFADNDSQKGLVTNDSKSDLCVIGHPKKTRSGKINMNGVNS